MFLLELCERLQATRLSTSIRESTWAFPIIESVHVLAICTFVGFVWMMDLRLVGATMRSTMVSDIIDRLQGWIQAGFLLMVISGVLVFLNDPVRYYNNVFFRIKFAMMLLAGVNALAFHSTVYREIVCWDTAAMPPRRARLAGAASLTLWALVIVAGRMIAYNWFD